VIVSLAVVLTSRTAGAGCPTTPDDEVCRAWSALLVPTAIGGIYAPNDGPVFYGRRCRARVARVVA
jgi:hypothetical protein